MSYADLASFKRFLRIPDSDTADDTELQQALDSAATQIDHLCSQTFAATESGPPEDRASHFDIPQWVADEGAYVISTPPLSSGIGGLEVFTYNATDDAYTTPVTLGGNPFRPLSGPSPEPFNAIVLPSGVYSPRYPSRDVRNNVLVLAFFGWIATPTPVLMANMIQAARLFKRRDAVFGIVGAPDGSDATRLLDRMDPDAVMLLRGGGGTRNLIRYWAAR